MKWARVKNSGSSVEFYSSYDPYLINRLKQQIPANARRPHYVDNKFKCWIVDKNYLDILSDLVKDELGVDLDISSIQQKTAVTSEQRMIRVEYIGSIKDRGGELSALGGVVHEIKTTRKYGMDISYIPGGLNWSVVFPELVLKEWFTGKDSPNISTYYTLLNIQQNIDQKDIKKAWRKMLLRYHPDHNSDSDAEQMTIKINEAYNILRNPMKRKKYDTGLTLQGSLARNNNQFQNNNYFQIPVRCGNILCTGHESVGRFMVERIDQWVDIVEGGKTLITSWDMATNSLRREWV